MAGHQRETLWSRTFVLLCLAQFLAYAHHALLIPAIPLYMTHLGGSAFLLGVTLAAFSAASTLVRPVTGYLSDSWSVVGVLSWGATLIGLFVLLTLIPLVEVVLLANALRGTAWAAVNTGGYTLLATIAPSSRRAEASGYYSGSQSSATTLLPALSLWLLGWPWGGFQVVFVLAALMGLAAGAIGLSFPRQTARPLPRPAGEPRRSGASAYLDRGVLLASAFFLYQTIPITAATSFLILYANEVGIGHMGWYFIATGTVSILARPALGRVSDRVGRGHSIAAGLLLQSAGLLLMWTAATLTVLLIAGLLYTLGFAIGTASAVALAMDRADPQRRGVAMGTFSMSFHIGMGLGAIVAGGVVELAGYGAMFLVIAALVASGLVLTIVNWPRLRS